MTTPNIEVELDVFLPYSIQYATTTRSVALEITDPKQRNAGNFESHVLRQGTYVVQMSYDGRGTCRLMSLSGSSGWVERTRVDQGTEFKPRTSVVNLSVPAGAELHLKLWGEKVEGYSGALTITQMPNYKT